jgi:hypothetical protein
MKNPTSRAPEWACKEAEGVEPGSPAAAEVGHDRQPGRNLTPGSVRSYELGVWKVKKEIPVKIGRRANAPDAPNRAQKLARYEDR